MPTVRIPRPPGCKCGDATADVQGRVLMVRTCPVCMNLLLDSMRGGEYSCESVKGEDTEELVLLKQREFFSR